jgi:hypothetical protein
LTDRVSSTNKVRLPRLTKARIDLSTAERRWDKRLRGRNRCIFSLRSALCSVDGIQRNSLRQWILHPKDAALLGATTLTRRTRHLCNCLRSRSRTFRDATYEVVDSFFIALHADAFGVLFCSLLI